MKKSELQDAASKDGKHPLLQSAEAIKLASEAAVRYIAALPDRRVSPGQEAVNALDMLGGDLPEAGTTKETLQLLALQGSAATTATAGGRFFGLVTGGSLPAAAGARVMNAAWDQIAFSDATSATAVHCETVAAQWMLDLLGLPRTCSVGFVTGATMSSFTCFAGARHALLARMGWNVEENGLFGAPDLRVVTSDQSHVTIAKALSLLGIGTARIETVPTDANGAMIADQMPKLDGRTIVVTQAGNVNTGACDRWFQRVDATHALKRSAGVS